MNFCIIGAGAIGANLAAQLAHAGHDISLVARGAHGSAIQAQGLIVVNENREQNFRIRVSPDGAFLPRPDAIFVAVKSTALGSTVPAIAGLASEETPIVFALNGLPWWYPHSKQARTLTSAHQRALDLDFLDPHGVLARNLGVSRVIGCVVYFAGRLVRPVWCNASQLIIQRSFSAN